MNDKKQQLIDTALKLFYDNGINSVGINEVLKVSGIAKKTLYNHFPSKDELVIATLMQRDHVFLDWLEARLSQAQNDEQVITQLFNALHDWFQNKVAILAPFRGCFFINTAAECRDKNNPIYRYCAAHKNKVRQLLTQQLESQDTGLIEMLCLLKEGAIVQAHLGQSLDATLNCITIAKGYLAQQNS